jgi:hypothetical protein
MSEFLLAARISGVAENLNDQVSFPVSGVAYAHPAFLRPGIQAGHDG